MYAILSPAKRLDFASDPAVPLATRPALLDHAAVLAERLRAMPPAELQALLGLSDKLTALNHERHRALTLDPEAEHARPALFAFRGDVYDGLDADSLDPDDLAWAQDHLGILSGLYGLLRPLDRIEPYRLEMGARLATDRGPDLASFWAEPVAAELARRLEATGGVLVNLASAEYFKPVKRGGLPAGTRVITPVFRDTRDGRTRTVFLYAKRARGAMARWIVRERLDDPDGLRAFDWGGYRWRADLSEGDRLVFERPQPEPAARGRRRG